MRDEIEPSASCKLIEQKPISRDDLKNFINRPICAGTRGFNDYALFSTSIDTYVKDNNFTKADTVFITGAARSGADALIIRWCKEHGWQWSEFHPNWDDVDIEGAVVKYTRRGVPYNVMAGFWRNEEMAEVGTSLIIFYDGVSNGTQDMLDRMVARLHVCRAILVTIEEE